MNVKVIHNTLADFHGKRLSALIVLTAAQSTRDHQGVALGDGVCVSHHQCVVIAVNNAVWRQLAEGTGLVCHRAGNCGQWLEASYAALILPGGWLIP